MTSPAGPNDVFADYGAFLHALLPQALGFLFHDRHGQLFWSSTPAEVAVLDDSHARALDTLVAGGELPAERGRIALQDCTAYLVSVTGENGRLLGVLTALADREMAGMPHKFCADLLQPAIRSLARELGLRLKLVDSQSRLKAQINEHAFLTRLSETVHDSKGWREAVDAVLGKCIEQFGLSGAMLVAPGRRVEVIAGKRPAEAAQVELWFESLQDMVEMAGGDAVAAFENRLQPDPNERARTWPILDADNRLTGILVLSRRADSRPWGPRIAATIGFAVDALEQVLNRSFDPLTGLINWTGFESLLDAACHDTEHLYSLMYLDMDQMQVVNDTFGRRAGDEILKNFAGILTEQLGQHAVTRVTSDNFAVLLREVELDQAGELANSVCHALHQLDYASGGQIYRPSVSIGVAPLIPDDAGSHAALAPAQIACQAAKDRGRGRVEVYVSSDASIVRRMDDLNQVGSIRGAIESGRLVLYAQPIVRLGGADDIANYELLVRMLGADDEPVEPSQFLGAAERYNLMQELDHWVVRKAIDALQAKRQDISGRDLQFAVNLSGQSLGNEQFLAFVHDLLNESGIDPARLCFEITETVAVSNVRKAQHFIEDLRKRGCRFSLDDFGTGLSSFGYLKMFAIDKLKIDGSFVHDIAKNEVSRSMVAAITQIAQVMNLETVAEYVEDESTLRVIRELGVNWAQGFHVGEPARLGDILGETTILDKVELTDVDSAIVAALPT